MNIHCCCHELIHREKEKKISGERNRLSSTVLYLSFSSSQYYMSGSIYFDFFFSENYIFPYIFSGIHLHLHLLLSLIPWRSEVLVVALRMLPVQEAWPVLALPWLNRKTLPAFIYDCLLWLKIVPGLQAEQPCPFASWWAKDEQIHKISTSCQTSMGTLEFDKMGSVWNENRQGCCPDESPPEWLYFLIFFFLKRVVLTMFFLSFLSTFLTLLTLNTHAHPTLIL